MVGKGGGEVEYVDLGLPSGLLWATCNIGADSPKEAGMYFSWGNVEGHAKGEGYNFNSSTYNSTPGHNLTVDIAVGDTYDIARNVMGSPWRLPTRVEFKELYDNTDSEWVSDYNGTGVAGLKFMKKSDHSVYIFFPACGYYNGTSLSNEGTGGRYWSSTYYSSNNAYCLSFSSSLVYPEYYNIYRYYGFSGRAVCNIYYPGRQGAFVYTTDGKFYTADEWSAAISAGTVTNDDAVGVAVISGEHRFVIAPQDGATWLPICPSRNYGITTLTPITDTDLAKQDFDGEANTDALIQQFGDSTSLIEGYAKSYTFKNGKSGYVPALGELVTAWNYKGQINACRSAIGLGDIYSDYVSSSTYYGYNSKGYFDIWAVRWSDGNCGHQHYDRGGQLAHYIFCSLD